MNSYPGLSECPSCKGEGATVHFQTSKGNDDVCPRCGDRFVRHENLNSNVAEHKHRWDEQHDCAKQSRN